jgi:hypothetical protein
VGDAAVAPVEDLHTEAVVAVAQSHGHRHVPDVLEHVGERLLDDAEGGEVDARGELAALPFDEQLYRQLGAPELLEQLTDALEPRLRRKLGGLGVPVQQAEQPTHLGERPPSGALDLRHGATGATRVGGQRALSARQWERRCFPQPVSPTSCGTPPSVSRPTSQRC